jgi:hypothetical protein
MITLGIAFQPAAIRGFDHFASFTLIFSTSVFFATISAMNISELQLVSALALDILKRSGVISTGQGAYMDTPAPQR